MVCKICGKPTKKPTNKFCSIECKIISQRKDKLVGQIVPNNNRVKCKITGKEFKDYQNLSGVLTKYSRDILGKVFDWADWEVFTINLVPRWNCPLCVWTCEFTQNRDSGGWIAKHLHQVHGLSKVQYDTQYGNGSTLWPFRFNKQVKQSNINTQVICHACGQTLAKLTETHIRKCSGITTEQYKERYPDAKIISDDRAEKSRKQYYEGKGMGSLVLTSKGEREILEFIHSLGFINAGKYRSLYYEIDCYIPELKVGIEYNGLFHHSQFRGNKFKQYHVDKQNKIESNGITLIQVFEDEWMFKRNIVKSKLALLVGRFAGNKIYARNCDVVALNIETEREFLTNNHLHGYSRSDVALGLIEQTTGNIVCCMTFIDINKRMNGINNNAHKGCYENVRSCTLLNTIVVGGISKLLLYFETHYKPNQLTTFADRRWSNMLNIPVYSKLGFKYIGTTEPCFWGIIGYKKRKHRSNFTKPIMNKDGRLDVNMTQEEMMAKLGYDKIWDVGNLKFVKNYMEINDESIPNEEIQISHFKFPSRKRNDVLITNVENTIECKICNDRFFRRGFSGHIRMSHNISKSEYISKYGPYL